MASVADRTINSRTGIDAYPPGDARAVRVDGQRR